MNNPLLLSYEIAKFIDLEKFSNFSVINQLIDKGHIKPNFDISHWINLKASLISVVTKIDKEGHSYNQYNLTIQRLS